jgi:hypothetical protein
VNEIRDIDFATYDVTNVHPLAIAFMVCMTLLVLAPRRSAATAAILWVCVFMPMDQRIVIGGLDFSMLRLITILALVRIIIRGEYRGLNYGRLDRLFLLWVAAASVAFLLRVGPSGFVPSLGYSFDALASYFVIRMLVRGPGDVLAVWKQVAWIVLVLSPFILYENATRNNAFGMFSYEGFEIAVVRDGKVRAKGPLSHPILTGTFGAVVIPVFVGIMRGQKKGRTLMGMASVAATIVTFAAGSSGPLMAWIAGALGWAAWSIRGRTRQILWGTVFLAVVIHFVREKPVWHLILRLSSITGGTGYHRYELIDAFIRRFTEWALVGTDNTAHWGWGLQDTTNHYVAQGVNGGLATLVLFLLLLQASFAQLRLARNAFERFQGPASPWAPFAWGCSVSLAVHCVSFISVSYFGQMLQFFFFFIATVPALARFKRPKRLKSRERSRSARPPRERPLAAAG